MKKIVRTVGVMTVVAVTGCLTGGCMGGLSLFSSTHTHYEGKPGMDERVKTLEHKVQTLEQTAQTNRVSHGQ
jgi:hypothetical protein